jgi:DnaA family protein
MRQLPLDVLLADYAVFGSFHPGRNAVAVASLRRAAEGDGAPILWIWGPPGSGRSHLLQASVALAHERRAATAYLPFADLRVMSPAVVEGMAGFDLLALDDIACVAGSPHWESALFHLYEGMVPRGARMLIAAGTPPAQVGFALPDLSSRLAGGATFRLEQLSDADCLLALQRRAAWRGLVLPDDTARFLLSRVARNTATLFRLLDRLDRAALEAQRRLTVPFVKSVLGSDG